MPSELGKTIRSARLQQGLGLREFAKAIKKSPAFVTQLECDDDVPSVAEETLLTIAKKLDLVADTLIVLAHRTPKDVVPNTALDVALYRKVKGMSERGKQELLKNLSTTKRQ